MAQAKSKKAPANGNGQAEAEQPAPPEAAQQGLPESVLWEKLGRQSVEIDLLRSDLQILAARNAALEEKLAEYKAEYGDLDEPDEG